MSSARAHARTYPAIVMGFLVQIANPILLNTNDHSHRSLKLDQKWGTRAVNCPNRFDLFDFQSNPILFQLIFSKMYLISIVIVEYNFEMFWQLGIVSTNGCYDAHTLWAVILDTYFGYDVWNVFSIVFCGFDLCANEFWEHFCLQSIFRLYLIILFTICWHSSVDSDPFANARKNPWIFFKRSLLNLN